MRRNEEAIRVSLITDRWVPQFSGAAVRFQQYLPGLRALGIDMNVVCATSPEADVPHSVSRWARLEDGGVMQVDEGDRASVYRVKLPRGPALRRNRLFRHALIKHLGESQSRVAHFLTLDPLRTLGGFSHTGAMSLFTGTLMWAFSENPLKRRMQRQWIRLAIQPLDHVAVSSVVMRTYFESLGVTKPFSIIPNGVDLQRFRSSDLPRDRKAARDALGIPATAHVAVFVGSLIHRKGVDLLLDAFARVAAADPLAELVLVGPRSEGATEEARAFNARIDALVIRSGASHRIHLVGYVPNIEMYLRAADVFVFPSRREGMGNVVLEAMAAGIPTVLTPYLGLPDEFGEPGRQYVLSAPEPDSLAARIENLFMDPERRQVIGKNGRRWVSEHMSMQVAIDGYANVYRDLAEYGTVRSRV